MAEPHSWIAIRGIPPDDLHRLLGIRIPEEGEDLAEATCTIASLPDDWLVVRYNSPGEIARQAPALIGKAPEVIACSCAPTEAQSSATAWRDGSAAWAVTAQSGQIAIAGNLPEAFAKQVREQENRPPGTDALLVPLQLAGQAVGFPTAGRQEDLPWELAEIVDPAPGPAHMAGAGKFGCFGLVVAAAGFLWVLGR